ncbi:hypothetical protein AB0M43_04955 [Longispora sp. NPDC051575]|uniref:hypothetical protein n=1 Tax=Longispora sp. NPDC051575 TaxID=3154943 RepID=UPI0034224B1C
MPPAPAPRTTLRILSRTVVPVLAVILVSGCFGPVGLPPARGAGSPSTGAAPVTTAPSPSPSPVDRRPVDGCTVLTSDIISAALDSPGPFKGVATEPIEGFRDWGCIWVTGKSYASLRELEFSLYMGFTTESTWKFTQVDGIGSRAYIGGRQDGTTPMLLFAVDGRYYALQVSKAKDDTSNVALEKAAEQVLGVVAAKAIAG